MPAEHEDDDDTWMTRIEPVRKTQALVGISAELLGDQIVNWSGMVSRMIRRHTHPWEFPDPCPLPMFDPFPRLTRIERRARRWRDQARVIAYNLTHLTEPREDPYAR